jgi:hypothetical protein
MRVRGCRELSLSKVNQKRPEALKKSKAWTSIVKCSLAFASLRQPHYTTQSLCSNQCSAGANWAIVQRGTNLLKPIRQRQRLKQYLQCSRAHAISAARCLIRLEEAS